MDNLSIDQLDILRNYEHSRSPKEFMKWWIPSILLSIFGATLTAFLIIYPWNMIFFFLVLILLLSFSAFFKSRNSKGVNYKKLKQTFNFDLIRFIRNNTETMRTNKVMMKHYKANYGKLPLIRDLLKETIIFIIPLIFIIILFTSLCSTPEIFAFVMF